MLGKTVTEENKSRFLICWTRKDEPKSGTRQAIVLAAAFNIPVFNLGVPSVVEGTEVSAIIRTFNASTHIAMPTTLHLKRKRGRKAKPAKDNSNPSATPSTPRPREYAPEFNRHCLVQVNSVTASGDSVRLGKGSQPTFQPLCWAERPQQKGSAS